MSDSTPAVDTVKASIRGNSTTKEAQLSRAKDAIEAGDQFLLTAAEALDVAQKEFKATQREIARAVGKSVAWVNRLLQWQSGGCVGTPFGPGSRAGRERQKRVQSTEQVAPRKVDAPEAEAGAEKSDSGKAEADFESPLAGFKTAVDHWWPLMNTSERHDAVDYAKGKVTGVMRKRRIKKSTDPIRASANGDAP